LAVVALVPDEGHAVGWLHADELTLRTFEAVAPDDRVVAAVPKSNRQS
jgi:hypothetical protein